MVTKLQQLTIRYHILQSPRRVRHCSTDVQMVVVSPGGGIVTDHVTVLTAATSAVSICVIIVIIVMDLFV